MAATLRQIVEKALELNSAAARLSEIQSDLTRAQQRATSLQTDFNAQLALVQQKRDELKTLINQP